jgi:hypothetical protein
LKFMSGRKRPFQKLTQLSQGNNVLDGMLLTHRFPFDMFWFSFTLYGKAYLEQRETISTLKALTCPKYSFQI